MLRILKALTLSLVVLVGSSLPAWADSVNQLHGTFPTGRWGTTAFFDGKNTYIVGGCCDRWMDYFILKNDIYRLGPDESLTQLEPTVGYGLVYASSGFDGTYGYIFGGWPDGDRIWRYDPATQGLTLLEAKLPSPRYGTSAIWTGTEFFIFGGRPVEKFLGYALQGYHRINLEGISVAFTLDRYESLTEIVRFDPATLEVSVMDGRLPRAAYTSAIWDGKHAYIFGANVQTDVGRSWVDSNVTNQRSPVLRYDPAIDQVSETASAFPALVNYNDDITGLGSNGYTSAVWDGSHALIFGACCSWGSLVDGVRYSTPAPIYRYNTGADRLEIMDGTFPQNRRSSSAVWTGREALIIGGREGGHQNSNEYHRTVLRYDPTPSPPRLLTARPGPNFLAHTTLTWTESSRTSYSWPLTAYRIYRGPSIGNETPFLDVPPDRTSFVDSTCFGFCSYYVKAISDLGASSPSNGTWSYNFP